VRFEAPWLLLGLAAAAIPIIIHLINRRRAPVVAFAAIEFILLSDKRLARKLKLKQLLALLLRIGLMLAIPFALARPYCVPEGGVTRDELAPTSVVLIIDNSAGMAMDVGGSTLLELAKARALEVVRRLGAESNAAVVAASRPADALTPELSFDRAQWIEAIEGVGQSEARSDLAGALRLAEALAALSTLPERRIVVLGDLSEGAWAGVDDVWTMEGPPPVELVDVTPDDAVLANAAVSDVRIEPAREASPEHIRIDVTVSAYGARGYDGPVTLELGGRTVENSVQVEPGEAEVSSFVVQAGGADAKSGVVSIQADAMPLDDRRAFAADLFSSVNVLVVDGAPRTIAYKDEVFFLERALVPAAGGGPSRIRSVVVQADDVTPEQLETADVVVMANVLELPEAAQAALPGWVQGGGGLLITAGDNVTEKYNRQLGELLPMPIRAVKTVAQPDEEEASVKALYVDTVETKHPIFTVFANLRDASLYSARFFTYLLLDSGSARADTAVLASYRNGAPLLVERRVGSGRVMLLTTTVDRDWTDLPIRTSYLPLMQQLMVYLSGRLDASAPVGLTVGDPATLALSEGDERLVVVRPDGRTDEFDVPRSRARSEVSFEATRWAGIYAVEHYRGAGVQSAVEHFAVGLDPSESDVARISADLAQARVAADSGEREALAPTFRYAGEDDGRTNVWPFFLAGLFVLLLSEAFVVVRGA
jgi:hypothetical protein